MVVEAIDLLNLKRDIQASLTRPIIPLKREDGKYATEKGVLDSLLFHGCPIKLSGVIRGENLTLTNFLLSSSWQEYAYLDQKDQAITSIYPQHRLLSTAYYPHREWAGSTQMIIKPGFDRDNHKILEYVPPSIYFLLDTTVGCWVGMSVAYKEGQSIEAAIVPIDRPFNMEGRDIGFQIELPADNKEWNRVNFFKK